MTITMESESEKAVTFFRFEDLRVYHKALDYIIWVQDVLKEFPDGGQNLSKRFDNASESIALNIAEGSARNKSQFVYYLKMAKSSVRECVVYTSLAYQHGYIDQIQEDYSRGYLMEMTKMIGALIGSLQRSTPNSEED